MVMPWESYGMRVVLEEGTTDQDLSPEWQLSLLVKGLVRPLPLQCKSLWVNLCWAYSEYTYGIRLFSETEKNHVWSGGLIQTPNYFGSTVLAIQKQNAKCPEDLMDRPASKQSN